MFTKVRLRILYIFLLLTTYSINLNAHEFWIEPSQYQSKDSLITAHLRVGQEFQGMALMYNPKDFKSFKILSGTKNKKEKVKGILGDVPAIETKTDLENLLIIFHETTEGPFLKKKNGASVLFSCLPSFKKKTPNRCQKKKEKRKCL